MESKPIALIICNNGVPCREDLEVMKSQIKNNLPDYRCLIAWQDKPEKDVVTMQVFNGDNITDVQFNELKKIIENGKG